MSEMLLAGLSSEEGLERFSLEVIVLISPGAAKQSVISSGEMAMQTEQLLGNLEWLGGGWDGNDTVLHGVFERRTCR